MRMEEMEESEASSLDSTYSYMLKMLDVALQIVSDTLFQGN